MSDPELDQFETELRRFPPAGLPEHLRARILTAIPGVPTRLEPKSTPSTGWPGWLRFARWLAPATVAAALIWLLARPSAPPARTAVAGLPAEHLQLDQKLVSSYDAIAQLPDGEPVRFRVRQWEDHVVLKDKSRGLIVEQDIPRLEVSPVRFEIY